MLGRETAKHCHAGFNEVPGRVLVSGSALIAAPSISNARVPRGAGLVYASPGGSVNAVR
jgi:hypothetical protein